MSQLCYDGLYEEMRSLRPAVTELEACALASRNASSSVNGFTFGVCVTRETAGGDADGTGVVAAAGDGPGKAGTAKGVELGSGVACGGGVALAEGSADEDFT